MPYRRLLLFVTVLGLCLVEPARAQPISGVVWEPPLSVDEAAFDLLRMHEIGIVAVRTPVLEDDRLLVLADSLGLQLFQELPLDQAPVTVLEDSSTAVARLLDRVLSQAQSHPSARHFGLVQRSDTADLDACTVVAELARRVRQYGPSGSTAYYVTSFVAADRCAEIVDLVLLDRFADPDPQQAIRRWRAAQPNPNVGIGALGTWVDTTAGSGLGVPLSAEQQARYLERQLHTLLGPQHRDLEAVFVYRWRDADVWPLPLPKATTNPVHLQAGLLTAGGVPRPAMAVVDGFFTGRQTVFAFSAGAAPRPPLPWAVFAGWIIAAAIGASYAGSVRFRRMVPRYFLAHGFYLEAVQSAREIPVISSAVLLGGFCLSVGAVGSVVLELLSRDPAFALFAYWLPGVLQELLLALLAQSALAILFIASLYALSLTIWMSTLTVLARTRQRRLSVPQMITLVLWPRWPLLLLMAVALGLRTLPEAGPVAAWLLIGGYLGGTVFAVHRTLKDYAATFLASPGLLTAAALVHPLLLLMLFAAIAMVQRSSHTVFLWHLLVYG